MTLLIWLVVIVLVAFAVLWLIKAIDLDEPLRTVVLVIAILTIVVLFCTLRHEMQVPMPWLT